MDIFKLDGKVVFVIGGNSGIGLVYVKGLVKVGVWVVIWGRNSEKNMVVVEFL